MNLLNITGFVVEGGFDPTQGVLAGLGKIAIIILSLFLIGFLIHFILYIISIFKHKIEFLDSLKKAINQYTGNFTKFFKYYIPVLIILVYSIIVMIISAYVVKSNGQNLENVISPMILIFTVSLPMFIAYIYYFILDNALALSQYHANKEGKFKFTWPTFAQQFKILIAMLIVLILAIITMPFLLIPTLFFIYILAFIRYPILIENKGVFAAVGKSGHFLKKAFWNAIFFIITYSIISSILGSLIGWIPLVNYLATIVSMLVFQPIATLLFTNLYCEEEGIENSSNRHTTSSSDPVGKYIQDTRQQGFSDGQIRQALLNAGYKKETIDNYF